MARKMKLLPVALIGILALVVLAGFASISMVGFFPGLSGGSRYENSDMGGSSKGTLANSPAYQGGNYWYYNPFSQSLNSFLFVLLSIIAPIITIMRLKGNNEWRTTIAAAIGAFFIAGALMVLTGALQNLFSFSPNSSSNVDAGDVYGWLFFLIIEAALGMGLLYLAEKWRKETGAPRSVYSIVSHTMGLFLCVYAAALFVTSAASAADLVKRSAYDNWSKQIALSPASMFGWLIYCAVLFYVAYRVLEYSKKSSPRDAMAAYAFHTPVSFVGGIATVAALIYTTVVLAAIAGANDLQGSDLLFAVIYNAAAFLLARWLVSQQEAKGIQRTGQLWLTCTGTIAAIFALLFGVFALYGIVSENYNDTQWEMLFFAILMLAYGGALLYASQKLTANKYSEGKMQEGSLFDFLYGEEQAKAARSSEDRDEVADLRLRMAKLEAKVARLEAAKKK